MLAKVESSHLLRHSYDLTNVSNGNKQNLLINKAKFIRVTVMIRMVLITEEMMSERDCRALIRFLEAGAMTEWVRVLAVQA